MPKGTVIFDYEKCKGCQLCIAYCPVKILALDLEHRNEKGYNMIAVTNPERCIGCAFCAWMCPDSVIRVEKENPNDKKTNEGK